MPDLPRRRALLAVASGMAALAGCTGEDEGPVVDRRRGERPIADYEVRHVRNEDGAVLFTGREELPTVTGDERSRTLRTSRRVVVTEERLADLTFADVPEADRLRSFATATDFEESSLYLLTMPVGACYEIRLRAVSVEPGELESGDLHPQADFCRDYLPADVECSAEDVHTAGFAIRLPVAAEQSSGSGRGMASSCGPRPRGEFFDATVTPAGGGAEE